MTGSSNGEEADTFWPRSHASCSVVLLCRRHALSRSASPLSKPLFCPPRPMILSFLKRSLEKRPLLTQVIAAGCITSSGDLLCQFGVEKRGLLQYDPSRTARFFLTSTCFLAPMGSLWFRFLQTRITKGHPSILPLKRVLIDVVCMSPVVTVCNLTILRKLEGYSFTESVQKMKRDWWTIWSNGLKVWLVASLISFYLLPLNVRIIFYQVVGLFWNCFLSYKTQPKLLPMAPAIAML